MFRKFLTQLRLIFSDSTEIALDSTALSTVRYEPKSKSLVVTFTNGRVYEYGCVDRSLFFELLQSSSKGRYFNSAIRNRLPYRQLVAANN